MVDFMIKLSVNFPWMCLTKLVFFFLNPLLNTNRSFGVKTQSSHPPCLESWRCGLRHSSYWQRSFKRTRSVWEKSTDGGVGVSVSFVGRGAGKEMEREWVSLPTFAQCESRRLFLFTAVTMQWAPFFVFRKKLISMSIKGSGAEGRLNKSLCTSVFDP